MLRSFPTRRSSDQCGVFGCNWRSNTNPKCNSHSNVYSNACGDTYSNTNSHRHAEAYTSTTASPDTTPPSDAVERDYLTNR